MASWTTTFEATPAGSASPSDGDDRIRELKSAIEERMNNEHTTHNDAYSDGTVSKDWLHKSGSASAFYQSSVPTTYPDGSTALDSNAKGRLWVDEDTDILYVYDGSGNWNSVSVSALARIHVNGGLAVDTDVSPQILFGGAVTITAVYVRVRTAPDGAAIRVDLNKNGGDNSIFGTNDYVEIADGANAGNKSDMDATNSVLSAGDYLTVDIDQVGSDTAGADLVIVVV